MKQLNLRALFTAALSLLILGASANVSAAISSATLNAGSQALDPQVGFTDPDSGVVQYFQLSQLGISGLSTYQNGNKVYSPPRDSLADVAGAYWDISENICAQAKINNISIKAVSEVNDFSEIVDPQVYLTVFQKSTNTSLMLSSVTYGHEVGGSPSSLVSVLDPAQDGLPDSQKTSLNGSIDATWQIPGAGIGPGDLAVLAVYATGDPLSYLEIQSVTIGYDDSACQTDASPTGAAPSPPKTGFSNSAAVIATGMSLGAALIISRHYHLGRSRR